MNPQAIGGKYIFSSTKPSPLAGFTTLTADFGPHENDLGRGSLGETASLGTMIAGLSCGISITFGTIGIKNWSLDLRLTCTMSRHLGRYGGSATLSSLLVLYPFSTEMCDLGLELGGSSLRLSNVLLGMRIL